MRGGATSKGLKIRSGWSRALARLVSRFFQRISLLGQKVTAFEHGFMPATDSHATSDQLTALQRTESPEWFVWAKTEKSLGLTMFLTAGG
jgi:hypothetical protein